MEDDGLKSFIDGAADCFDNTALPSIKLFRMDMEIQFDFFFFFLYLALLRSRKLSKP